MAAYDYRALTPDGRRTTGVVSADNPRAARRELRARRLTPTHLEESSTSSVSGRRLRHRLTHKQRTVFTRQMAVLLQSGMTIEQALTAAAADGNARSVRTLVLGVRSQVMEGVPLANAMRLSPAAFPALYCAVVAAGEASGRLPAVLDQLSSHLERTHQMTSSARAALVYPAVLGMMAILMIAALMVFVVPKLVEQFAVLGATELPLLTRIVISVSEFTQHWGWAVAIAIAGIGVLVSRAMRNAAFRQSFDRFVLALPLAGPLIRTLAAAQFARVHATLASSGATVIESLAAARSAMGNRVFLDAAARIIEDVKQGGTLSAAMKAANVFPPLMTHMVQSGEAARDVPAMMNRAAEFLESEFESSTRTLLSLLEPAIIVILGGIVGTIVLSIMLPIMQLNTLALG